MAGFFLHFAVPKELLEKLDEFRFENRFQSRSAAIIALLEKGLKEPTKTAKPLR